MNPPRPSLSAPRRIALLDGDAALLDLVGAWLADWGPVLPVPDGSSAAQADLLLVDVPFPRLVAPGGLHGLAQAHPGVPVIALSPTFFPGIRSRGEVARRLGVAAVLPKPVSREALRDTVQALLGAPA